MYYINYTDCSSIHNKNLKNEPAQGLTQLCHWIEFVNNLRKPHVLSIVNIKHT